MRVDRLGLEDFRNFRRAEVELSPALNLVIGGNAQGKTNLLEAVYCLSGLGSPRSLDAAVVRGGAERALLHADVTRGEREVRIDLEMRPGRGTRALVNKTPVPGLRALGELFVAVFFGPDELSLVKGSPEGRRRFLDDLVVKLRPTRDGLRREWERVLRQRNALLKTAPRSPGGTALATLEVWDDAFCRAGAALTVARLESLARLVPYTRKRYEAVAGGGHIELRYVSAWLDAELLADATAPDTLEERRLREMLIEALASLRARELERGASLVGPQRDDVSVAIVSPTAASGDLLDARVYGSQGEQRTCALALKLAENDLLTAALGEEPVLLLDDVFSELDPSRRRWLAEAVRGPGQTLLSSAEPGALEAAEAERILEVSSGGLSVRG